MQGFQSTYLPWITLAIALSACGAVGYFGWYISDAESARALKAAVLQEETMQFESSIRLHALARDTKETRTELESLVHTDVITIIEVIEAVGEDADVSLTISQVAAGTPIISASPDVPVIRPINASIEVRGTFSELLHAASLLNAIPFPSEVYQMQLERIPPEAGGTSGEWRFSARIKVLTTAEISS